MKTHALLPLFVVSLLSLSLVACGKKEAPPEPAPAPAAAPTPELAAPPSYQPDLVNGPVTVQTITLGNAISATKHVLSPLASFAPHDTIYAVVDSKGSGKANLKANWTFLKAGKSVPVNEASQDIEVVGPTSSEFHISKPDGWPAGEYQVEIHLNGSPVGVQKFNVK